MKALKFYDKEGVPYELYMDYEKQSVMMQIEDESGDYEHAKLVEFDEEDIDDIIIALVELKNDLTMYRNISNN